jgi:hypothetical protein
MIHKIFNDQGELIEVEGDLDEVSNTPWQIRRMKVYDLHWQLNCLYDDINAGLFGEAAKTGSFMTYINSIKEDIPKN